MKNSEMCAKLCRLRKRKTEDLFIRRAFRSEENAGGLAPTWLQGGHRRLHHGVVLRKASDPNTEWDQVGNNSGSRRTHRDGREDFGEVNRCAEQVLSGGSALPVCGCTSGEHSQSIA